MRGESQTTAPRRHHVLRASKGQDIPPTTLAEVMSRVYGLGNVNVAERDAVWSQPNNWTIALKSHASKVSRAVVRIECAYLEKLVKRKSTTPSNLQPGVPEVAHRGQPRPRDTLTCKRAEV